MCEDLSGNGQKGYSLEVRAFHLRAFAFIQRQDIKLVASPRGSHRSSSSKQVLSGLLVLTGMSACSLNHFRRDVAYAGGLTSLILILLASQALIDTFVGLFLSDAATEVRLGMYIQSLDSISEQTMVGQVNNDVK